MAYVGIKIKKETNELLDKCLNDFLYHHPEFKEIPISRNKLLYEMALFYLKH